MQKAALRPTAIWFANTAQLAGADVHQAKKGCGGWKRVKGTISQTAATAPAVGYPRVRFSPDGVTFTTLYVCPQDLTQLPAVVFKVDVLVEEPYVAIEWKNGAAPTTPIGLVWGLPE